MSRLAKLWTVSALAILQALAADSRGQQPVRQQPVVQQPGVQQPVVQQEKFTPEFRVTPMVRRLEAPRGKMLSFEFEVEAFERPTTLRIRTVGLRQQENGVIMPDEQAPPPDEMYLDSAAEVRLKAQDKTVIRGRLRVPRTQSKFHSFGILVKDVGQPAPRRPDSREESPRLGIRFVTQYLLRCDITVQGARSGDVRQLSLASGEVVEQDGQPLARIYVTNPTDSPFEFGVRCRLTSPAMSTARKGFPLVLPVRATLKEPERYSARILPHSRVRLEAPLSDAVFAGAYELQAELLSEGRSWKSEGFPIVVGDDAFPAQAAAVAQLADHVSIHPAAVELSLRKQGKRFATLGFANNGLEPVEIHVSHAVETGGATADWLVVRPERFTLPPRIARKLVLSVAATPQNSSHRYGLLRVRAVSQSGKVLGEHDVPVALLTRADAQPQINAGSLRSGSGGSPSVVVNVTNAGPIHVPLSADLTLRDSFGHAYFATAGYGHWLLPGESRDLRFELRESPPPGWYQARVSINVATGSAPIIVEERIELTTKIVADSEPPGRANSN